MPAGYGRLPDTGGQISVGDNDSEAEFDALVEENLDRVQTHEDAHAMESLEMEDPLYGLEGSQVASTVERLRYSLNHNIVTPVRDKIVHPINELHTILDRKVDYYLNKLGNPIILKKFIYILAISLVTWVIWRSGLVMHYSDGVVFVNHREMLDYAHDQIDLAKFETDIQYLSQVQHMSGTKGDTYVRDYIMKSMKNNKLDSLQEKSYKGYTNYPSEEHSNLYLFRNTDNDNDNNKEILQIELNEFNFNPLTINDYINMTNIIYGHYGSEEDFEQLTRKFLLEDEFVLLLHYSDEILVSEQILLAQQYNARGIIFISSEIEDENFDENDLIKQASVGIPQYGTGDALSPNVASSNNILPIPASISQLLPRIPILPISANQGKLILSELNSDDDHSILFPNGLYSGIANDLKINLNVTSTIREKQLIHNIIGKIDGEEQHEKAIIIGASRNSVHPGTLYPNFGTAALLSLIQLFQELRFKYKWTPMRSIYFISFGGSEFNHIGSTEYMEAESLKINKEIYSFIDISQLSIDNGIEIQCHPLLNSLFAEFKTPLNITTRGISQYGDWTPFLANGVPTSVLSSERVRNRQLPIGTYMDTFEKFQNQLSIEEKQTQLKDVIRYSMGTILELIDKPLIPFNLLHFISILDETILSLQKSHKNRLKINNLIRSLLQWKRLGQQWIGWMNSWDDLLTDGSNTDKHDLFNDENNDSIIAPEPLRVTYERWEWNLKLSHIGKKTITQQGLPGRKFYKNILIGPPEWNKYGVLTTDTGSYPWIFPSIQDAIWDDNWHLVQEQVNVIAKILNEAAHSISRESISNSRY